MQDHDYFYLTMNCSMEYESKSFEVIVVTFREGWTISSLSSFILFAFPVWSLLLDN